MSTLKGTISIKSPKEDESVPPIDKSNDVELVNFTDGKNLSKVIFFACMSCGGPLVPSTTCTCCKRIASRRCGQCGKIKDIQIHEDCKALVSFGNRVSQKFAKEVNL